ncbi:uncharacterized protein CIMG_03266 [Coccidioides immitis RS]|uniref:Uncharacterized protein n=1 Tax=Coccidioides immitis (strain RS) TaxID=246410 RepID=J3KAZ3_COCIM|nr:uncharacterized protein CIMG_03266 [Coccidioides immitis RS]EAS32242.3 hypothetical protein CIMG_03266 [Coccidioides immitis RS]
MATCWCAPKVKSVRVRKRHRGTVLAPLCAVRCIHASGSARGLPHWLLARCGAGNSCWFNSPDPQFPFPPGPVTALAREPVRSRHSSGEKPVPERLYKPPPRRPLGGNFSLSCSTNATLESKQLPEERSPLFAPATLHSLQSLRPYINFPLRKQSPLFLLEEQYSRTTSFSLPPTSHVYLHREQQVPRTPPSSSRRCPTRARLATTTFSHQQHHRIGRADRAANACRRHQDASLPQHRGQHDRRRESPRMRVPEARSMTESSNGSKNPCK